MGAVIVFLIKGLIFICLIGLSGWHFIQQNSHPFFSI
jgi:hypothetical protein